MYEPYWGLDEPAFGETPEARFVYLADPHEDALLLIHHFFARREGIGLFTGEAGLGKTAILRRAMTLLPGDILGCVVSAGADGGRGLRSRILRQIRRDPADVDLDGRLGELYDAGKKVVVAIDDTGEVPGSLEGTLAETLNLVAAHPALAILVSGLPGILERASAILGGAIVLRTSLSPLGSGDTARLIAHRLRTAGYSAPTLPFTQDALAEIDALSGGVPRLVLQYADRALLYGLSYGLPLIDGSILRTLACAPETLSSQTRAA